jgi:hypothetical protein
MIIKLTGYSATLFYDNSLAVCTAYDIFFQALNFLVERSGLLNALFPLPSTLDTGYLVFLSPFARCPV